MPTLNDLQHLRFSTNSGTTGSLPDVTVAYLQQVTGLSTNDVDDLWDAQLEALGYGPGDTHDMQFEYWGDLGYTGSWNDRYYAWLVDGGAFGPNVQIVPQGEVPTVGYCEWTGTGTCTASRQYIANDSGFTNPANQWVWSIDPPVAGVAITAGAGTDTVTVETQNLDVDTAFNLKVVATDTVSTDSAERTSPQTHYHREDLAVTIGEETNPGCTWPVDDPPGCTAQATYKSNHTGNPTSFVWTVSDVTGGTATLVAGQGTANCTVETVGDTTVGYKLTLDVASEFQTAQDSQTFQQTHAEESTGPAFYALTPDPLTYAMRGVLTGVGDQTATHTADIYAKDFEDFYRLNPANSPVYTGGRTVRNMFVNSVDFSSGWTVAFGGSVVGTVAGAGPSGEDVVELAFTSSAAAQLYQTVGTTGADDIVTTWVRTAPGFGELDFAIGDTATPNNNQFTINETWQKLSCDPVTVNNTLGFRNSVSGVPVNIYVFQTQAENVSGQSNQNPGEYVPTFADPASACYASTNGNTVLNNVVTEAVGTPLAEVPRQVKQWGPATNLRHNSNVVGTETPTVGTGKVSIVVFVNSGDSASAIVTAGTATATGYGTATPGSPVELDVSAGGTITVENTGTPFAVNVIQADNDNAIGIGPIITVGATSATDELVGTFDSANSADTTSAWYLEVSSGGAQNVLDGFLSVVGSNWQLSDGTTTVTRPWTANTLHQVGIAYDGTQMSINVDGTWSADVAYDGTMLQGILDLYRTATFGGEMRELQRFDAASYSAAQTIVDGFMP